jgi:hypothetical protein
VTRSPETCQNIFWAFLITWHIGSNSFGQSFFTLPIRLKVPATNQWISNVHYSCIRFAIAESAGNLPSLAFFYQSITLSMSQWKLLGFRQRAIEIKIDGCCPNQYYALLLIAFISLAISNIYRCFVSELWANLCKDYIINKHCTNAEKLSCRINGFSVQGPTSTPFSPFRGNKWCSCAHRLRGVCVVHQIQSNPAVFNQQTSWKSQTNE